MHLLALSTEASEPLRPVHTDGLVKCSAVRQCSNESTHLCTVLTGQDAKKPTAQFGARHRTSRRCITVGLQLQPVSERSRMRRPLYRCGRNLFILLVSAALSPRTGLSVSAAAINGLAAPSPDCFIATAPAKGHNESDGGDGGDGSGNDFDGNLPPSTSFCGGEKNATTTAPPDNDGNSFPEHGYWIIIVVLVAAVVASVAKPVLAWFKTTACSDPPPELLRTPPMPASLPPLSDDATIDGKYSLEACGPCACLFVRYRTQTSGAQPSSHHPPPPQPRNRATSPVQPFYLGCSRLRCLRVAPANAYAHAPLLLSLAPVAIC